MKKFSLVYCLFVTSLFVQGQTPEMVDSVDYEDDYALGSDRFIFNVHWSGWLDAPDTLSISAISRGIGLHFYYDIPFSSDQTKNRPQFSFAPGIGYSVSNYTNKAQFSTDSINIVTTIPFDESVDPKRNKLVLNYLEIPLEFRWRSAENNRGNRFKVAIGFKGGYLFSDHITYVGPASASSLDKEIKYKSYRLASLSTIQYGPTFRFGYGNINLEAYYGLNKIFEEGFGPSGTPITIGVSFNPF